MEDFRRNREFQVILRGLHLLNVREKRYRRFRDLDSPNDWVGVNVTEVTDENGNPERQLEQSQTKEKLQQPHVEFKKGNNCKKNKCKSTAAKAKAKSNNLERESERGESINRDEIKRNGSDSSEVHKENGAEKRLKTGSLGESTKSLDPYISIQGDVSSSREDPLLLSHHHRPQSVKKSRSLDNSQLGETNCRKETSVSLEQKETFERDFDDNRCHSGYTSILRRASSLSSVPSYFYPDPYSIAFPKYLDDLGSLSSNSSATGSERTEYLQLSRTGSSFLSPPGKAFAAGREERQKRDVIVSAYRNNSLDILDKMNFDSALSTSEEYQSFRSSVPLRKICVEADGTKEWKVYDAGPKTVRTPLLCLGPACATADVFYRQILNLTARGIRVISVEGPVYWSVEDWCKGLKKLLDCLNLDKVHIFGASLGGFLGQKFAEYTYHYPRVASLILCNTFLDTSIFDYNDSAMIFWMLPSVILKKLIIENITAARIMDLEIAHAIEFMIERLNNLSQQELASRMTLNCVNSHVDTFKLKQLKMTVMDVFDESALSTQARDDIYRHYAEAKLAHLKSGGNFPYLSRSDDVNMHIMVHLRTFNGTKHAALFEEVPSAIPNKNESSQPISTSQINGNYAHPEGSFNTSSFVASSVEDKNQAFKEEAVNALGLPVQ